MQVSAAREADCVAGCWLCSHLAVRHHATLDHVTSQLPGNQAAINPVFTWGTACYGSALSTKPILAGGPLLPGRDRLRSTATIAHDLHTCIVDQLTGWLQLLLATTCWEQQQLQTVVRAEANLRQFCQQGGQQPSVVWAFRQETARRGSCSKLDAVTPWLGPPSRSHQDQQRCLQHDSQARIETLVPPAGVSLAGPVAAQCP